MNLVLGRTVQRSAFSIGRAFGPIDRPECQGRCCEDRTAPVFVTVGLRGVRLLCAACRTWRPHMIRAALADLRRVP